MSRPRSLADADTVEFAPGVEVTQLSCGDRLQGQYVDMAPGSRVGTHAHPNEQLTFVLDGAVRLILGDESYRVEATESLLIPGTVDHAAEADATTGAIAFDVFCPPRDELPSVD